MDQYSPVMMGAVVLVAFVAGYSIISFVIRRFKSDVAKGRGDSDSRPAAPQEREDATEPKDR